MAQPTQQAIATVYVHWARLKGGKEKRNSAMYRQTRAPTPLGWLGSWVIHPSDWQNKASIASALGVAVAVAKPTLKNIRLRLSPWPVALALTRDQSKFKDKEREAPEVAERSNEAHN